MLNEEITLINEMKVVTIACWSHKQLGFHKKIEYDKSDERTGRATMKGKKVIYLGVGVVIVIATALDIVFKGLGYQLLQKLL